MLHNSCLESVGIYPRQRFKKTHYEKIVYSDFFRVKDFFDILNKEFQNQNFTYIQLGNFLVEKTKLKELDNRNLTVTINLLFHTYNFYLGSGRVYEISDGISDMLLNTKLDVDCSIVKSPFAEIVLLVPENLIKIFNKDTGYHNLYTIYVNYSESTNELRVLCIGKENENSVMQFDDAIYYFKVILSGGKVNKCLQEQMESWKTNPLMVDYSCDEEIDRTHEIFRLVINCLLYITSADPDIRKIDSRYEDMVQRLERVKSTGKKRKLERQIQEETKLSKYVIGSSIVKTPDEQKLYSMMRDGGKHSIRYPVGGHYRMQWYGNKENKFQKHLWIRPHFRGPELAELIRNIGVMK